MLKILTVPDPILRQKAKKVAKIDPSVQKLIEEMIETLKNNPRKGVGLAAPQVGTSWRIILAKEGRAESSAIFPLINPEIVKRSKETELEFEGCLSIPDIFGKIERSARVVVKGQNRFGKNITLKAAHLFARILQHEIDHLNGILITDKIVGKTLTEKEYDQLINPK